MASLIDITEAILWTSAPHRLGVSLRAAEKLARTYRHEHRPDDTTELRDWLTGTEVTIP